MLHILTKIESLSLIKKDEFPIDRALDTVLLTQDCVYIANSKHKDHSLFFSFKHCYFLQEDIIARGMGSLVDSHVQTINYNEMVSLMENNFPIISW